jgi:hypothetical protein
MHSDERIVSSPNVADGPPVREPNDLIPLAPFSRPADIRLPVFTEGECWEHVVRHGPHACMMALASAITNALNQVGSRRADYPYIDFKYFVPLDDEGVRTKKVKLRARLYQSKESQQVWILLQNAPKPSIHGVSPAS